MLVSHHLISHGIRQQRMRYARDLNEHAGHMRHFASKLLAGEANEVGAGDHGDVGEDEDEDMALGQAVWYATGQQRGSIIGLESFLTRIVADCG